MSREKLLVLANALYDDADIAESVVADAEKQGTTDRILKGELVLPSRNDATHYHLRTQGIPIGEHGDGAKARALVQQLIGRLEQLEKGNKAARAH